MDSTPATRESSSTYYAFIVLVIIEEREEQLSLFFSALSKHAYGKLYTEI